MALNLQVAPPSNACLICNGTCSSNRNTIQLFNRNNSDAATDTNVGQILQNILHMKIVQNSTLIDSQVVCKKCFKLIDEYGDLKTRLAEIRNEISDNYQLSYEKRHATDQQMQCNRKKLEINDNKNNILPNNTLPMKLLETASSGEEQQQEEVYTEEIVEPKIEIQTYLNSSSCDDNEDTIGNNYNEQLVNKDKLQLMGGDDGYDEDEDEEDNNMDENDPLNNIDITLEMPEDDDDDGDDVLLEGGNIIEVSQAALNGNSIEIGNQRFSAFVENGSVEAMELDGQVMENIQMIKLEPQSKEKPNILKKQNSFNNIANNNNSRNDQSNEMSNTVKQVGKNYICLLCTDVQKVTQREPKEMISHMKQVHETRLYICDVCGMHFNKRNFLSAHVDDHVANEEGDFQCEVCNRIFNNLRLFRIHRRMHQPQTKSWQCSNCTKKFSSQNLLMEHMNMHLGIRPYVCQTCGKDFASKYTFRAHEKTHESRSKKYKCNLCERTFLSQQNLSQHKKTHLTIREYQCHLCNKQFGSAHNLEVHSIVHTGYKPYVCGICGKSFARKAEIRDHERIHTGERPYQCEFCGATFSQRSNLQSHKRATHYNDKRYRCQECGKKFKRRRLLDYHIKAAHTGERPYKCETCNSTFVYPEHFKKHRRIHTGEKPFLCEVCGKAFNSRDNRNAHRFVHSDKKPYECLDCGTGFMRKPLLYQHMQMLGHVNDTIVVNQPRVAFDDKLTMSQSEVISVKQAIDECDTEVDSKVFITGDVGSDIIIDGQSLKIAQHLSDNEDLNGEIIGKVQEVMATDADYDDIMETPEGAVQLVKVKIPTDNGDEEEAWIKIVGE